MPPRYAYWTILAGGLPTAFRAAEREDLLPTFNRIQEKHPDAEMKWFARGKLWASPEAARQDTEARRYQGTRDRTWRPGGEHRDPRQPFKDAKQARNVDRRKQRFERKQHGGRPQQQAAGAGPARPWRDRPNGRPTFARNQDPEEPREPSRPRSPDREPRPDQRPDPSPPPRPSEPAVPPPGPPERGRPRRSSGPKKGAPPKRNRRRS